MKIYAEQTEYENENENENEIDFPCQVTSRKKTHTSVLWAQ